MLKFTLTILARNGQKIENIVVAAQDEAAAERKVKQMYRYCEVVSCIAHKPADLQTEQQQLIQDIVSFTSK